MTLRLLLFFISASMMRLSVAEAKENFSKCKKGVAQTGQCLENERTQRLEKGNSNWFSDTYSIAQERVFKRLQSEFKHNPWSACTLRVGGKNDYTYDKSLREQSLMTVLADSSEMFDAELMSFSGNIDLHRADQHVMANQADYNEAAGILDLYGDILYSDSGMALYGTSAQVNLSQNRSLLRHVSFILPTSPMRGSASAIYRETPSFSRYSDVTYTACEPGNQDWMLHASRMKVNNETGRVAIKHGWMEFKSVPVMYFPYGSFPVDGRRLTGLLTPVFSPSGRSGFDMSLPFYWNIAPNYDLTLTPRYMTKRGFMLGADFRYLWYQSEGEISVEIMPRDQQKKTLRWGGQVQHTTRFTENLKLEIDANYVSDRAYFSDLDGALGVNNRNRYLESDAEISYTLPWMSFIARVENFQNIDPNAKNSDVPYRRLPQVKFDTFKAFDNFPLELALDSEYVYFQRHFPDGEREGQRLNIKPSISTPFVSASGFIIPKVAMQHTQYWLNNQTNLGANTANSLSKTLPILSLDTGLFFERDFESLTHTIEPRLYYLYVPYTSQSELPDFDTSQYDFNINRLFRDNEFNGVDKTQNANQITAALTTRLVKRGRDRLKLTLGQIFYFSDRKVTLRDNNTTSPLSSNFSNLITELSSEITDELKFTSAMQWSHDENRIDRGHIDLRYHSQDNQTLFNVGYRFRQERIRPQEGQNQIVATEISPIGQERIQQEGQNQIVASAIIPIYDGWRAIGLYRYSFLEGKTLEYFYGIEKDTCCWRFRAIGRHFVRSIGGNAENGNSKIEPSFFFQLELKGLTSLGDKIEKFLSENISGYRKPDY